MRAKREIVSGVYKISSSKFPEIFYIGASCDIKKRWSGHISFLKGSLHSNYNLRTHVKKYGIDDLVFEIIELCANENLAERERYYINKLSPNFNNCGQGAIIDRDITHRVVRLTKDANIKLKKIFVNLEERGINYSIPEICDQLFELGIQTKEKELKSN